MSQTWTDNCYQLSHEGPADLQNIENNFACLKSMFSGSSAPSVSIVAGQRWYDTVNKLQRFYDGTNWICLMPGDATQKVWSYCNSVVEGMVLVTGLTDRVIALKGGSGVYNVNGGNTAGDWNLAHTHGPSSFTVNTYHRHGLGIEETEGGMIRPSADGWCYTDYQGSTTQPITGTSDSATTGSSWRPAASIGIIQRPDM